MYDRRELYSLKILNIDSTMLEVVNVHWLIWIILIYKCKPYQPMNEQKTLEKGCYHIYANIHFCHDWTFANTHQTFLFNVAHLQMQPLKRKLLQKGNAGM